MGKTIKLKNDIYIANDIYDYNEHIIGKWLGKILYRKVISFTTTIQANTVVRHPHNISNIDFIRIKEAHLFAVSGTDYLRSYPISLIGYEGTFNTADVVYCWVDRTNINITSKGGWSTGWQKIFVLEYTKM